MSVCRLRLILPDSFGSLASISTPNGCPAYNEAKTHPGNLRPEAFDGADINFTADPDDLRQAHFFIVAVPTPVDDYKVPDLKPLSRASESIGQALKPGDYVVYESTVYPGCTEDDCLPVLVQQSGLRLGY